MKIIQISPYYSPHLGGMEKIVESISLMLSQKGHMVEVFTSDIGRNGKGIKISNNLIIHYLKAWDLAHTPIIPLLFFKLMNIPGKFVMNVHISQAFIPEIVFLVSKIRNIPYVAYVHVDIEPKGRMGFLVPYYKKFILKRVLFNAAKIMVPTKDYIGIISDKYDISKSKISIIPCGIHVEDFNQKSVKLNNPIKLLFVGRLSKEKNLPLLIHSFKRILETKKFKIELHIVGEGESKNTIMKLIRKLTIEKHVFMHGRLEGKSLYKIYSDSDIFILTSVQESFGIVLLEAMASGIPMVASNIPGIRNVIDSNRTGLLVGLTTKDFATAIELLIINSQLRHKLIKNGLNEVKKYNWNIIIPKIELIYAQVLNEN